MEKILIVDNNKALAKLFRKKIELKLDLDVDIAHSMEEARILIDSNVYLLALIDLNLPDAPNGEIVEYVLGKLIPSIVLTSNIDKQTREEISKKDIIDYVNKEGIEDINYAISMIDRVRKNRYHEVLIVDDSFIFRKSMKKMLENLLFKVFVAAHGEEAINIIKRHPDIKLVITDYNMPVINGLELTIELRKTYAKDKMGIIAISSSDDSEVSAKFLKRGANDFIIKPFSKEGFSCRVNNTIEALENIDKIMNLTSRDLLTGAYNRRYFYYAANEYYKSAINKSERIAIAMLSIDSCAEIIKRYGRESCDQVIKKVSNELETAVKNSDIVARFGNEEFCILVKNISEDEADTLFNNIKENMKKISVKATDDQAINFSVSIGVATKYEDTLEDMIDQADMNLYQNKR